MPFSLSEIFYIKMLDWIISRLSLRFEKFPFVKKLHVK